MILHIDLNCFYASCAIAKSEGKYTPETKLAVAGDPERRHGIILAATYPAKKFGIRAGMPLWEAHGRCPGLIVVPPDYHLYMDYSDRFMKIISCYSPLMMRFGIDEAYIDYAGCEGIFGEPVTVAHKIRERVHRELGLTVSVGVGINMIRAKMGSDHKKPNAVTYLDGENWKKLIWPKPVEDLMYVGRATGRKLRSVGIATIGSLAHASPLMLKSMFGIVGNQLWMHANGLDDRRITGINEPQKCISHSMTLIKDVVDRDEICMALLYQTDRVAFRLREEQKRAGVVAVHARYSDLTGESRQATLERPTDITSEIYCTAKRLMLGMLTNKPVRQLGVRTGALTDEPEQIMLFDGERQNRLHRLDYTVDGIKKKYGSHAVMRAGTLCFDYDPKEDFTPFVRG